VKEGKMWEGREKGWREKKKTSKLGGEGKEGKGVQDRGGEKRKGSTALCLNHPRLCSAACSPCRVKTSKLPLYSNTDTATTNVYVQCFFACRRNIASQ